MTAQYRAFLVEESEGKFSSSITVLEKPQPQENEVLIKVEYSSLNYKDALCATGVKGCLLYTSPSPRDNTLSRMPSSA